MSPKGADEVSPRSGVSVVFVSDGDSFAPAGSVPPIPRRRQPPPTHCGAPRRNGRDLIIAKNDQRTSPYPRCCQRQRRERYKRSPEPTTIPAVPIPRSQHRQICTCPPRAKGPLDRRSKRLSFPHFFLRRKKCGRRRPPPRQGKIDSPPQRRNPPRAKGSLSRRFEWFSLVTFFLQKKKATRAGVRNSPSRARRRNTCSPPQRRTPPRAKGSLDRRSKWFSLVTFFLQKKKVTRAGARNSPSRARRQKNA